jgi:hypothetical protein
MESSVSDAPVAFDEFERLRGSGLLYGRPDMPHYDTHFCYTAFRYETSMLFEAMYLIVVGWMYVVVMMAVAEATAANGTLLGAAITFMLYGVMPLAIVLYLVATPSRRAARKHAQESPPAGDAQPDLSAKPDGGGHAAGDAVASKREEA